MKPPPLIACAGALALAGCTSLLESPAVPPGCRHEPGQAFIGQRASPEVGAAVLKATGATVLRWAPPGSALTMDFSKERVTVSYDDNLVIGRIDCG
jgi:hypothetical protein